MSFDADAVYWRWKRNKYGLWLMVCFVPIFWISIRKSCQRRDCSELGNVRNWVEHCNCVSTANKGYERKWNTMLCFYQMFFHSFLVNPSFQFLWPADTDKLYTHIIISSTEISFPIIITCDLSSVTQQDTHVHLSICVSLVVLPNYICMYDLFIIPSSTQTHEKESNTCFAFWHQQVKINRKNNQIKPFF